MSDDLSGFSFGNSPMRKRASREEMITRRLAKNIFHRQMSSGDFTNAMRTAKEAHLSNRNAKEGAVGLYKKLISEGKFEEAVKVAKDFQLGGKAVELGAERFFEDCVKQKDIGSCKRKVQEMLR